MVVLDQFILHLGQAYSFKDLIKKRLIGLHVESVITLNTQ